MEECTSCPPKSFCATPGLSQPTGTCYAGFYCMGGAKTASPDKDGSTSNATFPYMNDQCTSGYYCLNGTDVPAPCPAGYFSNQRGLKAPSDCKECPPGRYCDTIGLQTITDPPKCRAGFVCRSASKTPTPTDGVKGYPCPMGHYCPEGKSQPKFRFLSLIYGSHPRKSFKEKSNIFCKLMKFQSMFSS